jgi:alpha-2-macroglobulin
VNRLLLVVNAALALFLFVRAFSQPVAAAGIAELTADRVTVEVRHRDDGLVPSLVIDVGAPLRSTTWTGSKPGSDEPVDLGIELDPPQPVLTSWLSDRKVLVVPSRPLTGSATKRVVFTRDVIGSGGRIAAGTIVPFTTPAVSLHHVVVLDDGAGPLGNGPFALRALFDQPVTADAVKQFVRVQAAEGGDKVVPMVVELPPDRAQARSIVLRPKSNDELPDVVDVVVAPGLVAAGGDVATTLPMGKRIRWREPLQLVELAHDHGALRLRFSHAVSMPLAEQLRLTPALPFQVMGTDDGLRLVGDFAAGSVVTVELDQGFPGHGRQRLPRPTKRSLLVPDLPGSVTFAQGGQVLCSSARPELTVQGVNVERVHVALHRVYPNNLVRALQRGDAASLAPAVTHELAPVAPRNERWTQAIDLDAVHGGPLRGLYRVDLSAGTRDGSRSWPEQRWLQVTEIGVTWRAGVGSAVVHVRDLVRGGPVAAAAVTLLTPSNQVLASGTTDAAGLLSVTWPGAGEDRQPFVVLAQRGDDAAFAGVRHEGVELADDGLGGRAYAGEHLEAWVWADRGIVRPGETIDVATIVRDARGLPSPGAACTFRYTQPNGRALRTEPCDGGASGLAHSRLPLPIDAPMGLYTVAVTTSDGGRVLGKTQFRVEAFVPDRLEAEVLGVSDLRFGALGSVRVRGRWLDGSPAARRAVTARVRLVPHAAAFAGHEGFGFQSPGDAAPPGELPAVHGMLDDRGEAELTFALPPDAPQQTLLAHVAVEVLDPSGRAVHAASQAPVLRAEHHAGLRAFVDRCELRAVLADGSLAAGELAATVRLERRQWSWRYVRENDRRWRWKVAREATPLGEWNVTLQNGRASLPLPAHDADGALVATVGDRRVELLLGAPPARPDRLRVRGPSDPVAAGTAATIVVTSPAAGHGLVTIESDRVLGAFCCELARGDTTIQVPMPAGLQVPNVHAVVTLTRAAKDCGPDQGPAWLIGGAPIRLRRSELELPLALTAPPTIEPDHEWVAGIAAPGASSALVAVVDEGVLRVTNHQAPDPLAHFLANRRLATDGADNGSALLQGMQFVAGTKSGGDGDDGDAAGLLAGAVDSRIRPMVRFAVVPLDAAGRGEVRFSFGGYEGRVRAVAVAAGPVGMASARAETVVKAPLSVLVATPRMAAPGDRFVLPVTVRHSLAAGEVRLVATAAGALQLTGGAEARVVLETGAETTWEVPVVVLEQEGPESTAARLTVTAQLGAVQRTVAAEFTVRQPTIVARESFGFDLASGGELVLPPEWRHAEASVRLDARPEAQLAPVLEALLAYPYGCVEQTMAKGMALLACRALLPRLLGPDDPRVLVADAHTQTAVDRLLRMQSWGGGFGYWPGAEESKVVTLQVTDFLVQAKQHGLDVTEWALQEALDRCAVLLRESAPRSSREVADGHATARHPMDHDLAIRCLAADVLARAGRPVQPWLDWLCTAACTDDDRCHLASALAHLGQAERGLELLRQPGDGPTASTAELASPLRTQALLLRAGVAVAPRSPELPERALALQRALVRSSTTTQELWQGLRALADHYRRQPEPGAAKVAALEVDGQPVALAGEATKVRLVAGSVLRFAAGGSGSAVVTLHGKKRPDMAARRGAFDVQRTIVDVETGLPVDRCRRGQLYEVRLVITATAPMQQLAVVDHLPGGLEPEPPTGPAAKTPQGVAEPDSRQHGDDRVLLFVGRAEKSIELRHRVRATLPGTWRSGSVRVEAMYDPDSLFLSGPGKEFVVDP